MTDRPHVGAIVAILVVGALVGAWLIGTPNRLESYRIVDDDTIAVMVTTGGWGTWTWVRWVNESDERVVINVRTVRLPVPMTDMGYPLELVINLKRPLGDRTVRDAGPSGSGDVPRADS